MAYKFNGTTSYLELASAVTGTMPFTFAAWFAPIALGAAGPTELIAINDNSNNSESFIDGWSLEYNATGGNSVIRAFTNHGSAPTAASSLGKTGDNQSPWHHAAGIFLSSSSRTAFLDGIPGPISTSLANTPNTPTRTNIGQAYISAVKSQFYKGLIADAAIWNVALNPTEIINLALGVRPDRIRPASLLLWCPLDYDTFDYAKGNFLVPTAAYQQNAWPPKLAPRFASPRYRSFLPSRDYSLPVAGAARTKTRVINT